MEKIKLRRLTTDDADNLADMYKRVEIGRHNYKYKLSDSSEDSFKNKGGMFDIHDTESCREVLSSADNVLIGGECDGKLLGMIWYNLNNTSYSFDKISYFEEYSDYKGIIESELKRRTIFAGCEIIVLPEAKGLLAYCFFHTLLKKAAESGANYKTGEVYRVDGYEDETGFHKLDLLNIPSYKTLLRTGGVHIGTSPQRIIKKEGITYYITPQVFIWKINESLIKTEMIMKEKGCTVYEQEEY